MCWLMSPSRHHAVPVCCMPSFTLVRSILTCLTAGCSLYLGFIDDWQVSADSGQSYQLCLFLLSLDQSVMSYFAPFALFVLVPLDNFVGFFF